MTLVHSCRLIHFSVSNAPQFSVNQYPSKRYGTRSRSVRDRKPFGTSTHLIPLRTVSCQARHVRIRSVRNNKRQRNCLPGTASLLLRSNITAWLPRFVDWSPTALCAPSLLLPVVPKVRHQEHGRRGRGHPELLQHLEAAALVKAAAVHAACLQIGRPACSQTAHIGQGSRDVSLRKGSIIVR